MMAHELGVPLTLDVVTDLASTDPADYGGNPALRVPTLVVDGAPLFGTDNICRRLAELAGPEQRPAPLRAGQGHPARAKGPPAIAPARALHPAEHRARRGERADPPERVSGVPKV